MIRGLPVAVLTMLLLSACKLAEPAVRRYHARGVVTEIASTGGELSVAIHHERIAAFEDRDGHAAEMPAMTMIFGVAPSVPRSLFQQDQKLAFDFDVRWNDRPALWIVHAQALPATTELTLSP
jgi:Cu/Ag efflux protein CusF